MKLILDWVHGKNHGVISSLTDTEKHIVSTISGIAKIDLDAGNEIDSELDTSWYKARFTISEPMQEGTIFTEFVGIDFGLASRLRKVKYYLNGKEIAEIRCAHTESKLVIPGSFIQTSGENALIAVILDSVQTPLWLKEGYRLHTPEDFECIEQELPAWIEIENLNSYSKLEAVHNLGNHLELSFQEGNRAAISIWNEGVFRVTFHGNEDMQRIPLMDTLCLDELDRNLEVFQHAEIQQKENSYVVRANDLLIDLQIQPFEIKVLNNSDHIIFRHTFEGMLGQNIVGAAIQLDEDEHIFGLGENATPTMDKRGQSEDVWVTHDWVHCDVPIPFYISTKGYGFYLNNSYHSIFNMGKMQDNRALIWSMGGKLDYFFILGPDFKRIVSSFTAITGRSKLPPFWAFGFWQSKTGQDGTLDVMEKVALYKKHGLPLDVIGIDPAWQNDFLDLQWSADKFPEPQKLMDFLNDEKLHLILWSSPFVNSSSDMHQEGKEKGYFCKDEQGDFKGVLWWKGLESGLIDFTNPEAVEWWSEKLKPLIAIGIDGFKIDGGDGSEVPPYLRNYEGVSGSEFHNLYPVYYAKAVYEAIQQQRPGKRAIVWERTGFVGSGKYPCTWGGDQYADFSGMRVLIKAGQGAGMAGIPFWSQDVGGFGICEGTNEEFFIRSYQWGLVAPLSRAHGPKTEPWSYSEQALQIAKTYINLRYKLLPYLYSYAHTAVTTGVPIMRSLFLEYPLDKETYKADYQYFLGENIMAAPICEPSSSEDYTAVREVYLPQGTWIDFWTEEEFNGGQYITYKAAADRLPMFVKKGAMIPMASVVSRTADYIGNELDIHLYPLEGIAAFNIYEDDGTSFDYTLGIYNQLEIKSCMNGSVISIQIHPVHTKYIHEGDMKYTFVLHGVEKAENIQIKGGRLKPERISCDLVKKRISIETEFQRGQIIELSLSV